MIKIIDYIPEGQENAARASDIARWCGLDEREVRRQISKARQSAVILNFQDNNGYFIPTDDEKPLVSRWLSQEESRLKQHAMSLRAARRYVREGHDERITDFLPQLYGCDGGPDAGAVQESDDGDGTLCNG